MAESWTAPEIESELEGLCCLVIELPLLSNVVLHGEKEYPEVVRKDRIG